MPFGPSILKCYLKALLCSEGKNATSNVAKIYHEINYKLSMAVIVGDVIEKSNKQNI